MNRELLAGKKGCTFFLGVEAGALPPDEVETITAGSNIRDSWLQPNPNGAGIDTVVLYRRHYFGSGDCSQRFLEFVKRLAAPLGEVAIVPYLDDEIAPHNLFEHHRRNQAEASL